MDLSIFKKQMEEAGVQLTHYGMMVRDQEATMAGMDWLPCFSDWKGKREIVWELDEIVVGAPNILKVVRKFIDGYPSLEVVQPVAEACKGSYFETMFDEEREGLHHLCYDCPDKETFDAMLHMAVANGCEVVVHARGHQLKGTPDAYPCEFCYVRTPKGKLYIELVVCGPKPPWLV